MMTSVNAKCVQTMSPKGLWLRLKLRIRVRSAFTLRQAEPSFHHAQHKLPLSRCLLLFSSHISSYYCRHKTRRVFNCTCAAFAPALSLIYLAAFPNSIPTFQHKCLVSAFGLRVRPPRRHPQWYIPRFQHPRSASAGHKTRRICKYPQATFGEVLDHALQVNP